MWGLWFIKSNVIRDLASLNKTELLPWDVWGLMEQDETLSEEEAALFDELAKITSVDNWSFEKVRSIYNQNEGLKVPGTIKSYSKSGPIFVKL